MPHGWRDLCRRGLDEQAQRLQLRCAGRHLRPPLRCSRPSTRSPPPSTTTASDSTSCPTSAAPALRAPFVAGIVGLMKAANRSLSTEQVLDALQSTANSSPDTRVPRGYVDAFRAVEQALPNARPRVSAVSPSPGTVVGWQRHPRLSVAYADPETPTDRSRLSLARPGVVSVQSRRAAVRGEDSAVRVQLHARGSATWSPSHPRACNGRLRGRKGRADHDQSRQSQAGGDDRVTRRGCAALLPPRNGASRQRDRSRRERQHDHRALEIEPRRLPGDGHAARTGCCPLDITCSARRPSTPRERARSPRGRLTFAAGPACRAAGHAPATGFASPGEAESCCAATPTTRRTVN